MPHHPPDPLLVHRLPPAPHFVGRDDELARLRDAWASGFRGVLALVGLGGAGKTAVAACFLEAVLNSEVQQPYPNDLFVWSFYEAPDAGLFLEEAYRYFADGLPGPVVAKGAGLLHLLCDGLRRDGPHFLLLDGLERVQRADGPDYGRIEDPLLRGLLARLAEGSAPVMVLVTSRFPLTDLTGPRADAATSPRHYEHIDVGGLPGGAARELLRQRGVIGDDESLAALVERYGSHALTLDHLGGIIGQLLGGDPAPAPEAPGLGDPGADRQALRLARLLRFYEEQLPPEELALLCRLCLLRRGADESQVRQLFLCNPPVHLHTARHLAEQIARLAPTADCPQETLRALANAVRETIEAAVCESQDRAAYISTKPNVRETIEAAVCESPLAGPEETFRHEVLETVVKVLELHRQTLGVEVPELVRFYSEALFDAADERHPLSTEERVRLMALWRRYEELSRHPFIKAQEPPAALQIAFAAAGWGLPSPKMPTDVSPVDVRRRFARVKTELYQLTYRHFLLWRVRELCRLAQRKWALAGPLAPLDAAGLRALLGSLVERHLILRESGGAYSAHPAIRDHFARLAHEADRGGWHDLLREQMMSLARRPGRQLPEDAPTLDLVEEAIYHALAGGRRDEAEWLYHNALGGLRHLGWKLGEAARGLRVLRQFDPCPDRWALAWHLRALGELDEAYAQNTLPAFRADVRLLQGRFPHVAAEGDPARAAVAAFLMGETRQLPPPSLGGAVPRLQVLLYLGHSWAAWHCTGLDDFYGDLGWGGEQARCRLLLAELARRSAGLTAAHKYLDEATAWVLHSGSAEHLVLLHLVGARLARSTGEGEAAQRAADEGLRVARQCGLGLALIELLCEEAEIALARPDPVAAEAFAVAALERAVAADCRFAWGEAAALDLWGRALFARERTDQARATLAKALDLSERIGDPRAAEVGRLLARAEG